MNKNILKLAYKNFERLSKKYDGFINVVVDNWRGYRFVFDTRDVRNCKNNCLGCPLYNLLKNEQEGYFSSGLYLASAKDKKNFGLQKFLNCKTITQYKNCYINFLIKEAGAEKEIREELDLIKKFKVIYTKNKNKDKLEKNFKRSIITKSLKLASREKRAIIKKYI